MNRLVKPLLPLLMALMLSALVSCVAVDDASTAGAGILQGQKDENSRVFRHGVEETWSAALAAMDRLGFGVPLSQELGPMEAVGEFEDATDTIRLRVRSLAEGGARLIVRVGQLDKKNHRQKALVVLEETSRILEGDDELRAWAKKVAELKAIEKRQN